MQASPVIPWVGGKRRLADRLIPLFPPHQCYVEVFCGGAALYFLWPIPAETEILNDIQRAVRFFYLQQHAFGGKVHGQNYGTVTQGMAAPNLLRIEENLSAAHLRLSGTNVENLPWRDCIDPYDRAHTFFYCDPPYWQTEGYGVPFPFQEYVDMANVMRSTKGRMMVSINDHPDIREAFEGLPMMELDITYTLAKGAPSDKSGELVITNWDVGGLGGLFDGT